MVNEKRLIDANAIEMAMNERYMALVFEYGHYDHYTEGYGDGLYAVENAPTVDAVEVVHGRWNMDEEMYAWNCSVCRSISLNGRRYSYCHNCGAKMDGDGNA